MRTRKLKAGAALGLAVAAATVISAAVAPQVSSAATTESFTVNLGSTVKASTGVGLGTLYGVSVDGTQPADRFIQPLKINAYRGGGHTPQGTWISDGNTYGAGTQSEVAAAIAQAKRLNSLNSAGVQYQFILEDTYGRYGGESLSSLPCYNGDCSDWINYIDTVVPKLTASGYKFSYDIWNEPDLSTYWKTTAGQTQFFQMWDSAYKEIKKLSSSSLTLGPTFAYTPITHPEYWNTFFAHVKTAGTAPDWVTSHDEGTTDDPVTVGSSMSTSLSNNGISSRPLSANEYQPPGSYQNTGTTAWYLARFAQSNYANAMRGNWISVEDPNLTGLLSNDGTQTYGHWWAARAYADMTGTLVTTSNQVGTTAISASVDTSAKRAVAILGDQLGYTGSANVTFSGLGSVTALANNGKVNVVVNRIPDQANLGAPTVVYNQNVSTSSGSITVPFTWTASHDAYAIYITPAGRSGAITGTASGRCVDVPQASQALGVYLAIYDCNGQTNQNWHLTAAGELRTFNDSECLDVDKAGTADKTRVLTWPCNGQTNQKWTVNSNGTIVSQSANKCLDVAGAATAAGSALQIYTCNGGNNQKWSFPNNG